jgi:tetratricopeptide (TPR) repeat protein
MIQLFHLRRIGVAVALGVVMFCTAVESSLGSDSAISRVRVWQGEMTLPTYEIGAPDPNPPFEYFVQDYRHNYPYPSLWNLTGQVAPRKWRTLNLENEYIRCIILPDLGGHVYNCQDKRNGADMFYANPSFKFARIAYRGAWAAFGVEFNFPVSHNWMTVSPVDFSTATAPDRSASVWVGNLDRVYGMQWQVQLTLRPGQAALEEHVTLYNPSNARHRFYWWTNAGVQVWDDSKLYYPQQYSIFHGFTDLDTWPVNSAGVDLSIVGNHKYGPVSRFSYGSAEPYMGIYHPHTRAGLVHYSSRDDLPSKKVFSWGQDADALKWREELSDNHSAYIEIQAGLFRDQETHAFLEPQQSIHFAEYWIPIRDMEEVTRANNDAVLSMSRRAVDSGKVSLNVTLAVAREFPQASVSITKGSQMISLERVSLSPRSDWKHEYAGLSSDATYTVIATDREGRSILSHTENQYDFTPKSKLPVPIPDARIYPPASERSENDCVELGDEQERDGKLLDAQTTYVEGLKRFPQSLALHKAAGRLQVELMQYSEAATNLQFVLDRASTDQESAYYLGLAQSIMGERSAARRSFEIAEQYGPHRPAARFEIAALDVRENRINQAQKILQRLAAEVPDDIRIGAAHVTLLRLAHQEALAKDKLARLRLASPTDSRLRYEAVRLGEDDPALWKHLAADPERIIELASQYLHLGLIREALDLLTHEFPAVPAGISDPGTLAPQQYPLLAYYRGSCREILGQDGAADYAAASAMPTSYVFPSRPEQLEILQRAIASNPRDASVHFLLGSLLISGGMLDRALAEWELARQIRPGIPTLLRNMGFAVLASHGAPEHAVELFEQGTKLDPNNASVYLGLEQARRAAGRPIEERIQALRMFPAHETPSSELVFQLARDLAEAGQYDDAAQQLNSRFVAREEGGIGLREVYLDIRIQQARALAQQERCDTASTLMQHMGDGVPTLGLTAGELSLELNSELRKRAFASIEAFCRK